jgi:hypothetical protein
MGLTASANPYSPRPSRRAMIGAAVHQPAAGTLRYRPDTSAPRPDSMPAAPVQDRNRGLAIARSCPTVPALLASIWRSRDAPKARSRHQPAKTGVSALMSSTRYAAAQTALASPSSPIRATPDFGAAVPKADRSVAMQEIRSSRPWAWQSAANTGCSDPNCSASAREASGRHARLRGLWRLRPYVVPTQAPVATQTIRTDPTRATLPPRARSRASSTRYGRCVRPRVFPWKHDRLPRHLPIPGRGHSCLQPIRSEFVWTAIHSLLLHLDVARRHDITRAGVCRCSHRRLSFSSA